MSGKYAKNSPMGRRDFSFFGRPECGPFILEYFHLSADDTLVPMPIGHRISATDSRKNALKSEKTLPKHVLANGYPRDCTRVIVRQFWAQRSYRVCVSLKCVPIGKSEPKIAWSPLRCMFLKASEKQLPKRCHGSRDMAIFWSKIV